MAWYGGKQDRIDLILFWNTNCEYVDGKITMKEFAKKLGITHPTLKKYYAYWYGKVLEKIASGEYETFDRHAEGENKGNVN